MNDSRLAKVLVRNILEHAHDYPWTYQDIGLLGLRLEEPWVHRLHVWAPDRTIGPPTIHDHPYDFESTVIAGEMTNRRYTEDPAGTKYLRERYTLPDDAARTADFVQLTATTEIYREGESYAQRAAELHDSQQLPGTVTIIRRTADFARELTVCRLEDAPWVSGTSRRPTPDELTEITTQALARF
jgi:hypothetical protein